MFYGQLSKHVPSPHDLTVLKCSCGWHSSELSQEAIHDRGVPWYCDSCGRAGLRFVRFAPHERREAYDGLGIALAEADNLA